MTLGSVGWICPKCSVIISPYTAKCPNCTPILTIGAGTYSGWSGTITIGGMTSSGTIYAAPPKSDAVKLAEAQADAANWRSKFNRLLYAVQEVIGEYEDEDDE